MMQDCLPLGRIEPVQQRIRVSCGVVPDPAGRGSALCRRCGTGRTAGPGVGSGRSICGGRCVRVECGEEIEG